ncbi:non-ribosomal peptide synthetase [Dyella nitratireducens]|uniref:Non-ribosomal peptide synthetase n=1 Tax=Dyella nitratireducens TaxID=1849580 RepID=A0ABQ1G2M3_9GAMM|nr:non-ribosomal peptide synthetase [Dyella nitratireducens]GGA35435.1 non-ribosomal peptide synthetase [Dyella nitratireducens]GLQ41001.1 non-ribosomal peptide synthetase [Dyella nitratireducens]
MSHESPVSLPLTTAQRGLWVGQKIGAADATLNIAEMLEICGPVQPDLFIRALWQITREAETLRVSVVEHQGRPRQIVRPVYAGEFPYLDVSQETDPRAAAEAWMMEELCRPVDLANDPLWVSALFKAADDRYYWYQRAHHVIYDGYSGGVVARRLAELYNAYVEGREPEACDFGSLQELIEAEAAYRDSDRLRRDRDYWKEKLSDLPEAGSLSRLGPHSSMGGLRRSTGHLSIDTVQRLRELGKQTSTSLPQILIALVAAYYHRATGAHDLVIGMPVSGRINATLRKTPGMVANIVAIRLRFTPETTAVDLFTQVAQVVRQTLRHQQYRYEDLRRDLGMIGQGKHIAWLGVNIEPFDYQLTFAGARVISHNVSNGSGEDLTVFVYDRGDGSELRFDFDANPVLYSMADLDEHRRRLGTLVDGVLAEPNRPLGEIDILGIEERRRLLYQWNDTAAPIALESLPALVARHATLTPDAPAVFFEDLVVTYRELHERSVRQARQWIADGVLPGDMVAVMLPRNEQWLVVLLAIMRTGATFLPLDPDGPPERIAMMLDDASPIALIATPALCERFGLGGMLLLHPEDLDIALEGNTEEPDLSRSDGTAYVLYTSGSTGRPKGVEVTHRNLCNLLQGMRTQLVLAPGDRFLAIATMVFDIALLERFLPLTAGASVVIAGGETVRHPPSLLRLLQRQRATHMWATPSLWRVLLAGADAHLDDLHVLIGGEALSAELAKQLLQRAGRVTQLYGPTETTVLSTAIELKEVSSKAPPIGRPILNTRLYVLDQHQQIVQTGAIGELYIAGAGVAKGYLNHHQLTEARFLADPFADDGSRMYRTGDLVYWDNHGVLHFVGRADGQVKIRGHRVELGEIECQLVRHPAVAEAAVAAHREEDGTLALAGYVVMREGQSRMADELRSYLAKFLPDYMLPAHFVELDGLPLTPTGKLDRKALPAPVRTQRVAYAEPVSDVEKKLAALWQQVLGVERVGLHDNFFQLGGDSLSAAEMIARFPEYFGMELPLASLFEASTIAGLAAYLQRAESKSDPLGIVLPLRISHRERPLFCLHPAVGLGWGYTGLLRYLDDKVPVYGLQSSGLRGGVPLPGNIAHMAADYLAQIRRIQPEGPYRLLGWSLGGLIAHEITAQLQADEQAVEFLALLDAYPFVVDGTPSHADSREEIRAILRFLGFHRHAEHPPADLAALTDLLCREYGVFTMPLVQEISRHNPQLVEHVSAVTLNNLRLARKHVPRQIDADVMFFRAAQKEAVDLSAQLYDRPEAWRPYVDGRLEIHEIACHHQSMLDAAPAAEIGRLVTQRLHGLQTIRGRSTQAVRNAPAGSMAAYA